MNKILCPRFYSKKQSWIQKLHSVLSSFVLCYWRHRRQNMWNTKSPALVEFSFRNRHNDLFIFPLKNKYFFICCSLRQEFVGKTHWTLVNFRKSNVGWPNVTVSLSESIYVHKGSIIWLYIYIHVIIIQTRHVIILKTLTAKVVFFKE